jgi:hypothetical protein
VNKKTASIILLLALIAIAGLLQACVEAQPSFEVLSLNVTPAKINTGEKATIEAEVRNNNSETDTYNIPLMVNGVADSRQSVTLAPGASELITFQLTINHAGSYKISVGEKESTLVVEKTLPADFLLSNLEINPTEVDIGQCVVITAKITNVGDSQGRYTAELKVDGVTNHTAKLTIPAHTDYTLTCRISRDLAGTYKVTLGDLTGQFSVKEPPSPVFDIPPLPPPVTPPPNNCSPGG